MKTGEQELHAGHYSEAIEHLSQAIKLDAGLARAYAGRADAYNNSGKFHEALSDYNLAIKLTPKDPTLYLRRANLRTILRCPVKAIADYSKAIELQPNSSLAFLGRGMRYTDIGQYGKAVADLTTSIKLEPGYAAYYTRSQSYQKLGNKKLAREDMEAAHRCPALGTIGMPLPSAVLNGNKLTPP